MFYVTDRILLVLVVIAGAVQDQRLDAEAAPEAELAQGRHAPQVVVGRDVHLRCRSDAIATTLCKRLEEIRLGKNISQAELARQAGVSRSTMTRIADGRSVSLDSFIRVMQALGLADHLAALLPDPEVRPVERARQEGKQRRRSHSEYASSRSGCHPI